MNEVDSPCNPVSRGLRAAAGAGRWRLGLLWSRSVLPLCLALLLGWPAHAQVIHSIDTAGGQRVFPLGANVTFRIEFREVPASPWCGFAVDFGDGTIREFRAGPGGVADFPLILPYAYAAEGDYTIRVSGKVLVMGGLLPIQACTGASPFVRIRLQDERKRDAQDQQLRARLDEMESRLVRLSTLTDQALQKEQPWRARIDELEARMSRQVGVIEQQQRLIESLQRRPETAPFPVGLIVEIQALREQLRQVRAELAEARQSLARASSAGEQRLQTVEQGQSAIDGRQRLLDERFQLLSERQRLLEGRVGGVPSTQVTPVR